ncbi:hypothetical protein AB0G04_10765 [Actinoplanes sp. NPDC023801]|uniref:hypothetical protein n=1 Tax=Actinoplanes sp. NPDC023801 TaxID=3154595 RepID=UPI0033E7ECA9
MTRFDRRDGEYVRWRGRLLRVASNSGDTSVVTQLGPGEAVPAGYRTTRSADWVEPGLIVPVAEIEERFALKTWCEFRGERCEVTAWFGPNLLMVTAFVSDATAARLGMSATFERGYHAREVDITEVTGLRQERTEFTPAGDWRR